MLKVRGINNGDVEQAESLSVMLGIIYYLQTCERGRSIKEQWYGRRMAVSELESSYSFSDLSHLYTVEREKHCNVVKKKN